jgi:lipopolysaccharide cholinephosphotransferase
MTMDQILEKVHMYLLDIAKDFHEICLKNNLTYFIIGGTFLGAVRHKGFIPWDDDMDIGMPRESYERFLKLPDSALPSYLKRLNAGYKNQKRDFLYIKLCNKNTTLVENHNEKRIQGVYIDIFPLDGAHSTEFGSKLRYFYSRIFIYGIWLNGSEKRRNHPVKRIVQSFFTLFNNQKIYERANRMLSKNKYSENRFVGNFMGNWGMKEIMDKEFFGRPTLYKFEDTVLFGPEKPHEFLSKVYGDYMKMPPVEKQKSHHIYEYINLELGYEEYFEKIQK